MVKLLKLIKANNISNLESEVNQWITKGNKVTACPISVNLFQIEDISEPAEHYVAQLWYEVDTLSPQDEKVDSGPSQKPQEQSTQGSDRWAGKGNAELDLENMKANIKWNAGSTSNVDISEWGRFPKEINRKEFTDFYGEVGGNNTKIIATSKTPKSGKYWVLQAK